MVVRVGEHLYGGPAAREAIHAAFAKTLFSTDFIFVKGRPLARVAWVDPEDPNPALPSGPTAGPVGSKPQRLPERLV